MSTKICTTRNGVFEGFPPSGRVKVSPCRVLYLIPRIIFLPSPLLLGDDSMLDNIQYINKVS